MILVVDDEEMLLTITVAMLQRLGFAAITATTAEESYRHVHSVGSEIQLILLDYSLAEVKAPEVIREIRQLLPATPIIVTSGMSAGVPLPEDDAISFLKKPYSFSELSAAVQETLGLSS